MCGLILKQAQLVTCPFFPFSQNLIFQLTTWQVLEKLERGNIKNLPSFDIFLLVFLVVAGGTQGVG